MKTMNTLALTLGMLLAASTFVLAADKPAGPSHTGKSGMSGTSQQGAEKSEYRTQDRMGARAGEGMTATVQEVNQSDRTVTLRMQGGETVELQVPQGTLSNLQTGDSVEVSIRKSERGTSGTGDRQKSQPDASGTMPKSR